MKKTAFALTLALLASAAQADMLIDNANGIQVGPDGKLHRFTGLLVGDDGKVVRTLAASDARPAKVGHRIDAGARTLLPGLIDAHGHVMNLALLAVQLDLSGSSSLDEVKARLAQYATDNPSAKWIVGFGWNQELWPDKRMPTAADIDAVVSDRPVWVERIDGHAGVGNTLALKQAGITSATTAPAGGKVEKDSAGRPTGLFIDTAKGLVERVIPAPTDADRDRGLRLAQQILLGYGLTAVEDMGTTPEAWNAFQRLAKAGQLNFRILSYATGIESLRAFGQAQPWQAGDRLWLGGVKLYADGALGSRGAWLKQHYMDAPTTGLRFNSDAELLAAADEAAGKDIQVAIHAIGDAANAQVISTYEQLAKKYSGDRRWRIEHFQIADPADIGRLAPAGIIASMQPTHQTSDRLMAEKRLGPDRLAGAYAWQSVLKSGAKLAFGSDFPVESPNPFPGLAAAVSRQDMEGQPPGGWLPQERVSFAQALAAFTRDAAYAGFAEDRIGSLEPGKWADFIIVDRDVMTTDPQVLARTQVLETWIAGKKVWQRPHVGLDAPGERGK